MAKKNQIVIKANVLYDGQSKLTNKTIIIEGDQIVEISSRRLAPDFEGFITPAFIDAHSHIGMLREGEPGSESELNDITHQFLPLNDPLNSIYFDDRAFVDSVDFGVLYSCVVPGSGNLIGGQAKVIRHFATHRNEALVKDYGYKMAIGYNPRSTTAWKGSRPNTRMGIYAMLEQKFDDLIQKKKKAEFTTEKKLYELNKKQAEDKITAEDAQAERTHIEKEAEFEFSSEDRAILDLIFGDKTIKMHVHKEDDVLYLLELVQKYKLRVTADHTGDVFHQSIFEALGKAGIPIVYGPLGSVGSKVELLHSYYQNARLLMDSKADYGLMTDHPVVHSYTLRDSLKFFMIFGMSDAEAISLITLKNARILGLDDRLGSVAVGKLASLLVWDKEPLHLAAFPRAVLGEGKILRPA